MASAPDATRSSPWERDSWISTSEKVTDVVGLYLNPPDNAVVLSVDERPRFKLWTARS
jgi:hypothetical protein